MQSRRWAVLFLFSWVGCGYRFTVGGPSLKGNPASVSVPMMVNKTAEPGAETFFTQSLRSQLSRRGRLGTSQSPGRIEGEIQSIYSNQALTDVAAYRVYATVKLRASVDNQVVGEAYVSSSEDFLPGADILVTENNRQAALIRLSQRMMEDGWGQLATGW